MIVIPDTVNQVVFEFHYFGRRKGTGRGFWDDPQEVIESSREQLDAEIVLKKEDWPWLSDWNDYGSTVEFAVVRRDLDLDLYWVEQQLITLLLLCEYQLEAPNAPA